MNGFMMKVYERDITLQVTIQDHQAPHSWGFFVCGMMGRFRYAKS